MDSEKMASFAAKAEMDTMLQTVLELMDSDDGKDFEEKRKEAIEFLSQKKSRNVAEILVDLAIDDQTGKFKSKMNLFYGQQIHLIEKLFWRSNGYTLPCALCSKKGHTVTWFGKSIFSPRRSCVLFSKMKPTLATAGSKIQHMNHGRSPLNCFHNGLGRESAPKH